MSRWRIAIVVLLMLGPAAALAGYGGLSLWRQGIAFYVWWPMTACFGVGWFLAWYWMRRQREQQPAEAVPIHWTDRDREAWKLVEARAQAVAQLELVQLNEFQFYVTVAQDMALELARFYHPEAADPLSSLTVPEILAVVELASHDLSAMVEENVPGGHLMTVKDWRWAREAALKATSWYRTASNVYWLAAAVLSPIDTALRYAASQVGVTRPSQMFQQDLIAWFHTAFVHRLGAYLIDLNSGRLRVGAGRYRQLKQQAESAAPSAEAPVEQVGQVTLTVLGQVKMGKSSFINALLGEQRARTDVVPATSEVTRYELQMPDVPTRLVLLDTVGYAHTGPKEDQLRATAEAARQSDLLVLVLHARSPARQADVEMMQELRKWFTSNPDLRMPKVLAAVTHIDLLTPAMEWAPPYNWQEPQRTKEKQIAEAIATVHEQLGEYLTAAVPVCVAPGKVHGIEEWFLPALAELLGEAKAVGMLRCLRAEVDTVKVRKVFYQMLNIGEHLLELWVTSRRKRVKTP